MVARATKMTTRRLMAPPSEGIDSPAARSQAPSATPVVWPSVAGGEYPPPRALGDVLRVGSAPRGFSGGRATDARPLPGQRRDRRPGNSRDGGRRAGVYPPPMWRARDASVTYVGPRPRSRASQALLEPVVRVPLVVERLDLAVAAPAVERDRLGERPIGLEPQGGDAGVGRAPLELGQDAP